MKTKVELVPVDAATRIPAAGKILTADEGYVWMFEGNSTRTFTRVQTGARIPAAFPYHQYSYVDRDSGMGWHIFADRPA